MREAFHCDGAAVANYGSDCFAKSGDFGHGFR
jgi:hypothetical protein